VEKGHVEFGLNQLTPPPQKPEWLKCLETQKGFFNLLLWAGSILCFISFAIDNSAPDNLYLGIVLAFVVTATGIFEYFQEKSSSDLMKKFANMQPPQVIVIRGGVETKVPAAQLTHGDIVKVGLGDKIPADLRVITATSDCKVEQASLTGEPDALKRSSKIKPEHLAGGGGGAESHLEAECLMFFGTLCSSGSATAMVFAIGDKTVMGQISSLTTGTVAEQTPINKEIEHFVFIVASVAIFLGVSFFIIGVVKDVTSTGTVNITTQLVFMIGIIVANVPEGLLATVTVCLTLTAKRMAVKNVLVKNLESVETLGSTSCICSDKTGTLTQNKMTTTNICCDGFLYEFKYAATEGTNAFPKCDMTTNGPKTGTVTLITPPKSGAEWKGTVYNIDFDDTTLAKSGNGWITAGMIEKDGKQGEEHWTYDFEGCDDAVKATKQAEYKDWLKVGDKVTVNFSNDTLRRINRVCAVQNKTSFDGGSKKVQELGDYSENDRIKIKNMFDWKSNADWKIGADIKFRFRELMKDGKTVKFHMDQWLPNADASSNALVRWCNDKPLWDDESYKVAGIDKPAEFKGALHLKDTYTQDAVDHENSQAGMEGYKKAFPKVTFAQKDAQGVEQTKVWGIQFNSKNKFAVSAHLQNNDKSKNAILLMKGGSDVILKRCDTVMHRGKKVPLTPALRARYEELNLVLAKLGRRVLSSAELEITPEMIGMKEGESTGNWTRFEIETDDCNFPLGTDMEVLKARAAAARAAAKETGVALTKEEDQKLVEMMNQGTKLCFLGMTALIDPHRPSVPGAIDKCHSAGILVVMVTGDHPATAEAIAKEIGIIKTKGGATYSDRITQNLKNYGVKSLVWNKGQQADNDAWWQEHQNSVEYGRSSKKLAGSTAHPWNDEDVRQGRAHGNNKVVGEDPDYAPAIVVPGWEFTVDTEYENEDWWPHVLGHREIVFARTSPKQKLLIVEKFQQNGMVVAVTGDGVNDAPALKKANIGVAMGIAGTEVSKDAADMILLDDNFASIVNGVEEGRLIFDNLKKSIAYTLSSNIPEISPFLSFITVGIPLPLSTVLILCIDLGTDMVPAISMAWENKEADIMKRPPRDQHKDRLVTRKLVSFAYLQVGVIQAIAGFYSYMVVMGDYGYYSYTLPGLGADDAWQKVQLMCQVDGGVLRNEDGYAYPFQFTQGTGKAFSDAQYGEINNAMAKGYMFWDWSVVDRSNSDATIAVLDSNGDKKTYSQGVVNKCVHVPRVINSNDGAEPTNYDWGKPEDFSNNVWNNDTATTGTGSYTGGRAVASVNHIIAMKRAGWIEYNPFAARMSAFYDSAWKYWEPQCASPKTKCPGETECCGSISGVKAVATIQGFGQSGVDAHFAGTPIGYRILPAGSKHEAGTAVFPAQASESITKKGDADFDKYWMGGKQMPERIGYDGVRGSWGGDVYDIPSYENYGKLTSDYTNAPQAGQSANKCSSWEFDGSANIKRTHQGNCNTAPMGLADNMYSWMEKAGASITYRVNVVNRMLQREALAFAQTSGFTTIIVVQWADLMICKTRWLSIRQQGMSNPLMNFGLLFETILGAAVCFVPFLNVALQTRPLRLTHWFPGMPFMVLIFMYDETRKYLMRNGGLGIPPSVDEVDVISGQISKKYNWVGINTYY
jgi:magnesium-transporting ATPase (P-type)